MFTPSPMTAPSASSTTAPIGTSPAVEAVAASSSARRIEADQGPAYGSVKVHDVVELVAEADLAGDLAEHLFGVEVVVVEQGPHVGGAEPEVGHDPQITRRCLV